MGKLHFPESVVPPVVPRPLDDPESGTLTAREIALRALVDIWPSLPDATVNEILKLAHGVGLEREQIAARTEGGAV